jgi:PPOX class probable F420-dependent enzyme
VASIPEPAKKLLSGTNFAHIATLMSDGSPQVTPVWIDHDGDTIIFNTAEGRLKHKNLERDGRVALSVIDQENPYAALIVRGRVKRITREGADEHIDALAKRYMGVDTYPLRAPGEVRVIVEIEPEKVAYTGE